MSGRNLITIDQMRRCIDYFSELIEANSEISPKDCNFKKSVTDQMNDEILRVPDCEEVKGIVMSLNKNKSPGPDGFNECFF